MPDLYEIELIELLSEEEVTVKKREQTSFNGLEEKIKENGLVLFGCGGFGKRVLKGLRQIGIEPLGFSDSNKNAWNSKVEELTVYSPEEGVKKFPKAIHIVTIWSDIIGHPVSDVEKVIHSFDSTINVTSFFFLFWKYPLIFIPYFGINLPSKTLSEGNSIKKALNLFKDDASRKEFVAQIRWRLKADYAGLAEPSEFIQYFPEDIFQLNEKEVFVDCGAFDGDTLKNFLKKQDSAFAHYFAFEPDPSNFKKLKKFSNQQTNSISKKITVHPFGVSDKKKQLNFSSDGTLQSSFSENGNIKVECIAIDEFLNNEAVSYIKMDAEGSEPEIIEGSVKFIEKNNPIFAVSVYHVFNHLWTLPLRLNQLSNKYEFFLRPHCRASWDLICYAVPKHRIIK